MGAQARVSPASGLYAMAPSRTGALGRRRPGDRGATAIITVMTARARPAVTTATA